MPIEIRMAALSPEMTEGTLVQWLKQVGDAVAQGEPLLEIEGDKAVVEVPAPQAGVLAAIAVPAGSERVAVDTVIGWLSAAGEAEAGALPAATAPPTAPAAAAAATAASVARAPASTQSQPPAERIFASPLARRLANEQHVDIAQLRGSGPNGRILKADVEAAAPARPAASAPAQAAYEELPHSSMRRVIASRLADAKRNIPHFYLTIDCEVDALLAAREQANRLEPDLRLSVNDCVVKAAALALRKVPAANVAWTDDAIRRFRDVDIAVAVGTPGGLITPIVRRADTKGLAALSREMRELAARAMENRLRPEEFQGGGFTVSNLGMHGIREFSAIINPPQACILAVGAAEQRPVVRDGALAVATLMTCTLSVDHRCVDGVLGAQFLAAFKRFVEAPIALAL